MLILSERIELENQMLGVRIWGERAQRMIEDSARTCGRLGHQASPRVFQMMLDEMNKYLAKARETAKRL